MGSTVGVGSGVVVSDGVGCGVTPDPATSQVPTAVAHVVGSAKLPLSVKPRETDAPGAIVPFHDRLVAVRTPPARKELAFHIETLEPFHGTDTDHLLSVVVPVLVTTMSTLRPVPQSLVTLSETLRALVVIAGVVGVGVGLTVGLTVGVGAGVVGVGSGVTVEEPEFTAQVTPETTQVVGVSAPPLAAPMNPNVTEAPGASAKFQLGPEKRYPPAVLVAVASQVELMAFA